MTKEISFTGYIKKSELNNKSKTSESLKQTYKYKDDKTNGYQVHNTPPHYMETMGANL